MDEQQFDKRMALLKKSYDRMEPQLDPVDVFAQIKTEEVAPSKQIVSSPQKHPAKWQKPAVWAVSIASVLLVGVLVMPYFIKQPENLQSEEPQELAPTKVENDEWIENITKKYQSKKEQIRKELKVSADELAAFEFIKTADSTLNYYIKSNLHLLSSDVEYLKSTEEVIFNDLMTPRRALESVKNYNSLTFDESYEVYRIYVKSVEELERFYSKLLEPYAHVLMKTKDKEQLPSDVKVIIEAANNQFMELHMDEVGVFYFKANPIDGEFAPNYINQLHPDIFGFFEYLQKGDLLLADDLRYTREETLKSLKIMERSLLVNLNAGSPNYKLIRKNFENTWLALLKGTENYPATTKTGEMNEQYIDFLQKVSDGTYGEIMRVFAEKILKEIQQDRYSETLVQLSTFEIWKILLQRREETIGYINDSDFNIVGMNESIKEQIKAIYEQYTMNGDEAIINQLRPINLVALYLYASINGNESVKQSLLMQDARINANTLQQIKSLDVFSELGEYDGIQPIVAVRVTEGYQDKYGRQFIIKVSYNKEGHYRIIEISD
ncbi:hypothetical protein ACQKII_22015 [Lysinibacillus sp. NPDC048646]|uniref:hypothetical protein n=1 Tax=Lysinibacillus sp. NPDC048646 TaxID=3390574 RepID=UPI003D052FE2